MMRSMVGRVLMLLFSALFLLPVMLVRCHPISGDGQQSGILVRIYRCETRRIITMDLETYIKGVVAAEMPEKFGLEALKAQAVAARTVTVRRLIRFGGTGSRLQPSADLSDDPAEGQAWYDRGQLRNRWGFFHDASNWNKISQAVDGTRGVIITYNGKPIDAVFHSTSGPRTENSEDVWGKAYPYLRSVDCPFDRDSPRYFQQTGFTPTEFMRLLGVRVPSGIFKGVLPVSSSRYGIQVIERSSGGRIQWIRVGGVMFQGEEFRRRLGLRSTRLSYSIKSGKLWIETVGYGHGVGLCQYGAEGMAKAGYDFRTILHYYYTGVELRRIVE